MPIYHLVEGLPKEQFSGFFPDQIFSVHFNSITFQFLHTTQKIFRERTTMDGHEEENLSIENSVQMRERTAREKVAR